MSAAVNFWAPYGSSSGWNYEADFDIPSALPQHRALIITAWDEVCTDCSIDEPVEMDFELAADATFVTTPTFDSTYSSPMTLTYFGLPCFP